MIEHETFDLARKTAKSTVHVIDSLGVGGLERTVVRLAIAQKESGDNVQIITIWENGPLEKNLTDAGIRITCLNKRAGFDYKAIKQIRNIVSNKVEIIHSHNQLPHYYATIATLGLNVRRINTRHDMGLHLKSRRMQILYRLSLIKTHSVIAVCEAAKSRFIDDNLIPEHLLSVIYNGTPTTNQKEKTKTDSKRKYLKLPEQGQIVGSIGRLNAVKDYGTLISAFKEVLNKHPTANLVIAGEGPDKPNLVELIKKLGICKNVTLLGERNDVEELLEQFDVFALTSLTEGFSVALVEAAWSGLPIVATNVGGNEEIINDGITGYLAESKNIFDIKTKLDKLLDDDNLRTQFGQAARQRAEENWTLELMLKRYRNVYEGRTPNN